MRHESAGRRPGDFQAAIDAWGRALELDPNQYIWRRRIEQYGPRLAKPYAFYDWIVQARAEISRRGETPIPLTVEPYGSELAGPVRDIRAEAAAPIEPDPKGRDPPGRTAAYRGRGGRRADRGSARARPREYTSPSARARPTADTGITNPPRCGSGSPGPRAGRFPLDCSRRRRQTSPSRLRSAASTSRSRHPRSPTGKTRLAAYALYNACEQAGGRCLFLRQDLSSGVAERLRETRRSDRLEYETDQIDSDAGPGHAGRTQSSIQQVDAGRREYLTRTAISSRRLSVD